MSKANDIRHRCGALLALAAMLTTPLPALAAEQYSVIVRGGMIYDGDGGEPYRGDVAIQGDRIVAIAPQITAKATREIDARGLAVSPGFINMLAHPELSLLIDGRAQSDLRQGVTLEVMGEFSMGPLSSMMREEMKVEYADFKFDVDWATLGQYLARLERQGISVNVASFVGAGTVRQNILGAGDVQPTPLQLTAMRKLVREAMEEGALGLTTALIYVPDTYTKLPELVALAEESARCGGIYTAHMRSEGALIAEAVDEMIAIAKASGAPAHIYHLKFAGRENWGKRDAIIAKIEAARASGTRITADMYNYTAGATGLDASMPPWVQAGGVQAWIARLKDPAQRAKVIADMRDTNPTWENLGRAAGAEKTLLLEFKNPALRKYIGKSIADVAMLRGTSVEDTIVDLVIEDGSRVGLAYFLMSEDNLRRQVALPWVSFNSDADAPSLEGVFLEQSNHPRAYGNFARLIAKYVRDEKVVNLPEAIRKLTALPADTLSLADRGRLKPGMFADLAIFDPAKVQDHATFEKPLQYATGMSYVIVNGRLALDRGEPTADRPGRAVRSRSWTGRPGGGCRAASSDWSWVK